MRFLLSSRVDRSDNITQYATHDAAPPHSASPRIAERGSVGVAARPRTRPPSMPDQTPAYDIRRSVSLTGCRAGVHMDRMPRDLLPERWMSVCRMGTRHPGRLSVRVSVQRRILPVRSKGRSPGTGFDLRRLFSQAREGREDPRTEPHAPAHAAPENPTPITLEDMSDQEGAGSASNPEATLTHPSARDNFTY